MHPPSSPAVKPKMPRVHPGNQWADGAFRHYVERKLSESQAEITSQNVQTLYAALLTHALPAGNT